MRIHQRHTTHQAASATSTRSARLSYSASRSRPGSRCAVTLMIAAALIFNALPLVSTTHAMNDAVRPTAASLDAPIEKAQRGRDDFSADGFGANSVRTPARLF